MKFRLTKSIALAMVLLAGCDDDDRAIRGAREAGAKSIVGDISLDLGESQNRSARDVESCIRERLREGMPLRLGFPQDLPVYVNLDRDAVRNPRPDDVSGFICIPNRKPLFGIVTQHPQKNVSVYREVTSDEARRLIRGKFWDGATPPVRMPEQVDEVEMRQQAQHPER